MSQFTAKNPFMNGPMMDMWSNTMEMYKKSMESMKFGNFTQKNQQFDMNSCMNEAMQSFKDMVASSSRNADSVLAIWRRKTEIFQRHASEVFEFTKKVSTAGNPEDVLSKQAEFLKDLYASAMADFKELSEMYSKSNLEAFEDMSKKCSDNLEQYQDKFSKFSGATASCKADSPKKSSK